MRFDTRDFVGLVGVGLIAGGFYLSWPPGALIVPGILLFAIAVWRAG